MYYGSGPENVAYTFARVHAFYGPRCSVKFQWIFNAFSLGESVFVRFGENILVGVIFFRIQMENG